ncbi:hypothetical protein [Streptomyces roseus]|uniref:Lipoprotein n=1 Tax=Streptomyces roseus TaxID=66430 RepID=A0A0J7APN9_9ACTN|nr:hypothetical protein [Streptomyces roseus]KMO99201.1 hypothetical protein ACS04_03645 [Streptomyces roseus]
MKSFSPSSTAYAGLALLLLPLLGACSAGASGPQGSSARSDDAPGRSPVHRLDDSKTLELPLDAYLLTTPDLETLSTGRDALVQRCLAALGAPAAPAPRGGVKIGTNERRYGLADPELAKAHGYHLPDAGQPIEDYPPAAMALVRGEVTTYNGKPVPEGGCAQEAGRELHDTELQQALGPVQRLDVESYETSRKDPAVTEVSGKWSTCMEESGYRYPDPVAAINDREFASGAPSDHEKAVALADVLCKRKVNLIGVWSGAESAYQRSLIKSKSSVLAAPLLAKEKTMSIAKAAVN